MSPSRASRIASTDTTGFAALALFIVVGALILFTGQALRSALIALRDDRRLNLNPAGRQQTKKHRPIVPVNDLLHEWLSETDEWFVCKERISLDPHDQTPVVEQIGVKAVRSGWDSMRQCLNIPDGWGPKLIRHSMSSELRKRRVDPWELSGQLGHRVLKTSETYAIYDPDYLGTVQMGIKDVLTDLEKACGSSIHPTFTQLSRANAPC